MSRNRDPHSSIMARYIPRLKLIGLTAEEKTNQNVVEEYAENFEHRRDQARARIPQQLSPAYKIALQIRFQTLRDLSQVCESQLYNSGVKWRHKSVFIKECEMRKLEFESEKDMLILGFPFLEDLRHDGVNDV